MCNSCQLPILSLVREDLPRFVFVGVTRPNKRARVGLVRTTASMSNLLPQALWFSIYPKYEMGMNNKHVASCRAAWTAQEERGREAVETTTGRKEGEQLQHENRFGLNECCSCLKGDFARSMKYDPPTSRGPTSMSDSRASRSGLSRACISLSSMYLAIGDARRRRN